MSLIKRAAFSEICVKRAESAFYFRVLFLDLYLSLVLMRDSVTIQTLYRIVCGSNLINLTGVFVKRVAAEVQLQKIRFS